MKKTFPNLLFLIRMLYYAEWSRFVRKSEIRKTTHKKYKDIDRGENVRPYLYDLAVEIYVLVLCVGYCCAVRLIVEFNDTTYSFSPLISHLSHSIFPSSSYLPSTYLYVLFFFPHFSYLPFSVSLDVCHMYNVHMCVYIQLFLYAFFLCLSPKRAFGTANAHVCQLYRTI